MRSLVFIVILLLAAGCSFEHGALSSDGGGGDDDAMVNDSSDAPPGACDVHDFDGDGLGDSCDKCPHISSANVDTDGDGVGDECDPRPTTPGEHREIWLAFYDPTDTNGWVNTGNGGTWSISANLLHQTKTTNFALLDSPMSYSTDAYFATSVQITEANTSEVGFCLSDIQPSIQYYCCGASNAAGASVRAASGYSTSGGQISAAAGFAGNLSPGQHVEMTGTLIGSQFKCHFSQGQVASNAMTATGSRVGTACFYTVTLVDYRYLFLVTIGS